MKKIIALLVLSLTIISCNTSSKKQDLSYAYTGVNWDKYEGHTVEISVLDSTVARVHAVTETVFIKNGAFKIADTLKQIRNAYFGLYTPKGDFVYKQEFILEPGSLEFNLKEGNEKSTISGGKYNDIIYTSFLSNTDYNLKNKTFSDYSKTLTQESFQVDSVRQKYSKLSKIVQDLKKEHYLNIYNNKTDSITSLLAFSKLGYTDEIEQFLDVLEKQFGKGNPEIYLARNTYKMIRKSKTMTKSVGVGSVIKDFSSKNLKGKTFKLSNVLKENKYVGGSEEAFVKLDELLN
ncbi:DUF4369 domain-containing protein [Mariniflexile sp. AS56]|nr:DUF4369 domain-containing protein [Mariniflexile sp. AS56]MDO7171557.1 DUF4369 domain-containing protein [Mariniflexile sp. AS56]